MTDREWWDSLPQDAEFLPPPGECGGLLSGALWVELSVLRTWERYVP
jgi:hypothetical protein